MSKLLKRVLSLVVALVLVLGLFPVTSLAATETEIVFNLGDDVDTTTHADGTKATEPYTETVGNYILTLTGDGNNQFYTGANDATGNGCLKLGKSKGVGGFTFTAPEDVTKVIIAVAGYKANTVTVSVNGTTHAITTVSNNGAYTNVEVDTSSTKDITFVTTSTGYRAMINSITYVVEASDCEHTPVEGSGVVTDPDCTSAGYTTYTCASCGEEYTADVVDALGHTWDDGVVTDPTCTYSGYTIYTCTVCGATNKTDYVDYEGHAYVIDGTAISCENCDLSGTVITVAEAIAVCEATGTTETTEDYYVTGTVSSVKSDYYGNVYIVDEEGNSLYVYGMYDGDGDMYKYMDYKPVAGDTVILEGTLVNYKDTTPEMMNSTLVSYTEHGECDYTYSEVVTDPTCTEAGYTTGTCICGATSTYNETEALGHTWDDATCTAAKTCSVCGETEGESLGHDYEAVVTAPTCTEAGYTTYTCACGDTYTADEVEALGHSYVYENNYDGTHDYVCSCGDVSIDNEEHIYVDGVCVCGEYEPGTEANPILLLQQENTVENTGKMFYQGYFSGMTMTVTGEGEFNVIYNGETIAAVDGVVSIPVSSSNPRMPVTFALEGTGTYQVNFTYPEGHMENPAQLSLGYNYASVEAGNSQGYYYTWTAPVDGTLTLTFSAEDADWNPCGWVYAVNNMTSYVYGDTQWSDSDPVVNPAVITVKAGDEIQVMVNSYDPANPWSSPAADVLTVASFECTEHAECHYEDNWDGQTHNYVCSLCGTAVIENEEHVYVDGACVCGAAQPGTEQNPIMLYDLENTVENTGTVYYQCYFSGTMMSINSDNDYKVIINGETQESFYGMFNTNVETPNPRMPFTFAIEGEGTFQINFTYPEGSMMNPADLFMGYNYASIEAGNSQGYYYTWCAFADGTLTLNFSATDAEWAECGWTYVVNNLTTGMYGDTQWSDSDPVVNPYVITVKDGDEIQLIVNTYDPANMWNTPAGKVETFARFECADHKQCEYQSNFDGTTHDFICVICGTILIDDEPHDYADGACVCGLTNPGTETNPIMVEWIWNEDQTEATATVTVPAGATVYYGSWNLNIQNELTVNGQATEFTEGNQWTGTPSTWTITNSGDAEAEYTMKLTYKEGTYFNPAELVMGDNVSAHDGTMPYYYTWTAPMDGTLTLNMASTAAGWVYVVNNMTTGVYGDYQWSDSDPVVNPAVIEVVAGEVLMIEVNTYDPADPWLAPEGNVTVTASFAEDGVAFAGMTMTLGNSLAVNFVIDSALLEGDGHYAVITKQYADGTAPLSVTVNQADWAVYSGSLYYFTFTGVKAKEMTDEFTVIVYNADGEQVSVTYTRTVEDYCYGLITKYEQEANYDAERLALYVDILNYGAAAQDFFEDYNIENLANARLTEAQQAYATQSTNATDIRVKGAGYAGSTLSLLNEIQLNFVYNNTTINQAAYAVVSYTHHDGAVVEYTVEAADFQEYGTARKYVQVTGLKIADGDQVVTVTLYDAAGNVLSVSQDSVNAYAVRKGTEHAVYDAVLKLVDSAYNYFH